LAKAPYTYSYFTIIIYVCQSIKCQKL